MTLLPAYQRGCTDALHKFALEAPSPVDALVASIDQAPDAPPPAGITVPGPMQAPMSLGKEAALGLQQMIQLEKLMGRDAAHEMFADVERQMQGRGGGRTGTLRIGPEGTSLQPNTKLPAFTPKPTPYALAPKASLGAQAADSVITSAKRFAPGVRVR